MHARSAWLLAALVASLAAACSSGSTAASSHGAGSSGPGQPASAAAAATAPPASSATSRHKRRRPASPAARVLGLPPVRRGPVPGYVLIADRDNNRLIIVSPRKRIVWRFPARPLPHFSSPDDAFFTPGYRRVITNEEFNEAIAVVAVRARRTVWRYGHPGVAGSSAGYLDTPDDAYQLPDGDVVVADIRNCRVVRIDRQRHIVAQLGTTGVCAHDPPRELSSPNGDTPLPDGGLLVTEIGGWVDRFDRRGRLRWSVRTPTTYPSDAQLLPSGNVLVAGFNTPGRVDIISPAGRILWSYGPASGYGELDRPSLAVRWPNGMIAVTDDWDHRVVVIDPRTKRIVWQYGHRGMPGSGPGYLDKPDGLDLLPAARG